MTVWQWEPTNREAAPPPFEVIDPPPTISEGDTLIIRWSPDLEGRRAESKVRVDRVRDVDGQQRLDVTLIPEPLPDRP